MSALANVLQKLPGLSGPEIDEVQKHISALRTITGTKSETSVDNSGPDLVLSTILQVLQAEGIRGSFIQLKKSRQYKSYTQKTIDVMSYLRGAGLTSTLEYKAALFIGISILRNQLGNSGWSVNATTLMLNIHNLPSALNSQFPGYAANKMLALVINRKV